MEQLLGGPDVVDQAHEHLATPIIRIVLTPDPEAPHGLAAENLTDLGSLLSAAGGAKMFADRFAGRVELTAGLGALPPAFGSPRDIWGQKKGQGQGARMSEAFFYQLNGDSPEAVLPRMLDMALGKGWRIEVRGLSRDRMERLDLALWGEGGEFRPHGLVGGPHDSEQPILLTVGAGQGGRDCLMALDGAPVSVTEAQAASRVCVVFDGADPEALATARGQWKALTGAGLAARYYVRENGTWTLRQERPAKP